MTLLQREVLAWRHVAEKLRRGTQALRVEVLPSTDKEAVLLTFHWAGAAYTHKLLLSELYVGASEELKTPRCRKLREVCQLVLLQRGVLHDRDD